MDSKDATADYDPPENLLDSMRSLLEKERILRLMQLEEKDEELRQYRSGKEEDDDEYRSDFREQQQQQGQFLSSQQVQRVMDLQRLGRARSSKDEVVRASREIKSLELSGLLGRVDLDKIVPKLRWLPKLQRIVLSHNFLDDNSCGLIEPLLDLPARGYTLDLSHNHLGHEAATMITCRLGMKSRPLRNLQSLQLQGSQIMAMTPNFGAALAASLASGGCPALWGLGVTLIDVEHHVSRPVEEKRGKRTQLRKPMNASSFFRVFPERQKSAVSVPIEYLSLAHGSILKRSLSELVAHCLPKLAMLDLANCFIGCEGAAILARGLSTSATNLATLLLPGNMLGSVGAEVIAQSLAKSYSLTHLDVADNVIGTAGALALAKAIAGNLVITVLNVGGNLLGDEAVGCLMEAFYKRSRNKGAPFDLKGLDTLSVSVKTKQLFRSAQSARPLAFSEETFATKRQQQQRRRRRRQMDVSSSTSSKEPEGKGVRFEGDNDSWVMRCNDDDDDAADSEDDVDESITLAGSFPMNLAAAGGSWQ